MLKLYVLIRDDMSEAQQAVQAGHAIAKFGLEHPEEFRAWQEGSNTLIYLSVVEPHWWATVLADGDVKYSMFREPDRAWQGGYSAYTAVAVAPNWACQYVLFKDLPLALQTKTKTKKWWKR